MIGDLGLSLIHPNLDLKDKNSGINSPYEAKKIVRDPNNRDRSNSNNSRIDITASMYDPLDKRAAGLTINETEKLRDMKYNLAADYRRQANVIENEKGGLYDRAENSGVKGIFVPH